MALIREASPQAEACQIQRFPALSGSLECGSFNVFWNTFAAPLDASPRGGVFI